MTVKEKLTRCIFPAFRKTEMGGNDDIFTWFPRREDYEIAPAFQPDETLKEKITRLNETIAANQTNIKEVVDGNEVGLEHKIYRTMDLHQDMEDMAKLLKECEGGKEAEEFVSEIKQAKVGIINLKAYLSQVDCLTFANAIQSEYQFKVGYEQGFVPWLEWAENKISKELAKPTSFEHGLECEKEACLFLKTVVKGNKNLKKIQAACDGLRGNITAQEAMGKLQERYYVLCKKAEQKVKNLQHLLTEWKRLDDFLKPEEPKDWDDFIPKQMLTFLKTYQLHFA